MSNKSERYQTVGFIRVRKNQKGFFYTVSIAEAIPKGSSVLLRIDNEKLAEAKKNDELLGNLVIGQLTLDTEFQPGANRSKFTPKQAAKTAKPAPVAEEEF